MSENNERFIPQLYGKFILVFRMINRQHLSRCANSNSLKNFTIGQGRILKLLTIKPEISQKELHGMLDISKQSLAETLSKLEKNGFIVREPSEEDRRVLIVKLTEEGKKEISTFENEAVNSYNVFKDVSDEELKIFGNVLDKIIVNLENDETYDDEFLQKRKVLHDFMLEQHKHHRHNENKERGKRC